MTPCRDLKTKNILLTKAGEAKIGGTESLSCSSFPLSMQCISILPLQGCENEIR